MVPEVHGVEKELDPHLKPEQQYLSKGATPKWVTPKKIVKTPTQGSIPKQGLREKTGPVRVTPSKSMPELVNKTLLECPIGTL